MKDSAVSSMQARVGSSRGVRALAWSAAAFGLAMTKRFCAIGERVMTTDRLVIAGEARQSQRRI